MTLQLKILGSNSASFAHNRHHTSQVLQIQNQNFLIDCGEGTQLLLKKNKVKLSKIDNILISHLHGDHYYGLIGLISTLHLYGRRKPLVIVGPPGLAEIITIQLKHSATVLNYKIEFIEWEAGYHGVILENEKIIVSCIPLNHRIPCSGYYFKEKPKQRRINRDNLPDNLGPTEISSLKAGKDLYDEKGQLRYSNNDLTLPSLPSLSYAYCSDTKYDPSIIPYISDSDILYHEATFQDDMLERASNTFHSTSRQAAMIARDAHVKKLIIGHFSTRYKNLDSMLTEAQEVFENTHLAVEGYTYGVDK